MMGGDATSDAFGNGVNSYLIVDTDGSIQPNDALRVCEHGITQTEANVKFAGFDDLARTAPFAYRLLTKGIELCATCQACPEVAVCGGGYVPHRYSRERGFDNPSAWCDDIKRLLRHMRSRTGLVHSGQPAPDPV